MGDLTVRVGLSKIILFWWIPVTRVRGLKFETARCHGLAGRGSAGTEALEWLKRTF